jgi:maltodextrin utilization protein YvdJ
MYMFRYFIGSLKSLKSIFDFRNEKGNKVLLYFILVNLIFSFPMNLHQIRNKGLNLDAERVLIRERITEDFVAQLPNDCSISTIGINCHESVDVEVDAGDLLMVFNASDDYEALNDNLVFYKDKIIFRRNDRVTESSYELYYEIVDFQALKQQDVKEATTILVNGFEESSHPLDIPFGIVMYTGTNLFMNGLYILIAGVLARLLKYGHSNIFPSYKELVKMFVFASTWPSVIGFGLGLFELYPFMNVIYQFGTPLMFLLVYNRQIKQVY